MLSGPPRRRRARAVPDAPIDALLVRGEDLAKGWLLALLEQAPLEQAPDILAAELARDGPRVCEAVVRAVGDETDLRRLQEGGALRPLVSRVGDLSGASTPEEVSGAVEALRAIVWAALIAELPAPEAEQVLELAERLALVCELVRAAALERTAAAAVGPAPGAAPARGAGPVPEAGPAPGPPQAPAAGPAPEPPQEPWAAPAPLRLAPREEDAGREAPPPAAPQLAAEPEPSGEPELEPRLQPELSSQPEPDPRLEPEPAGEGEGARWWPAHEAVQPEAEAQPLWVGALEEEIRRSAGAPLSLLLVTLEDAERVAAIEPPEQAGVTFGQFARAVRAVARRQDILVCETESRAWIIARDTGRAGARALGSRVTAEVGARRWRGAGLSATVGLAVLGEDGRTGDELIEAAEEACFAAAASGVGMLNGDLDEGPGRQG